MSAVPDSGALVAQVRAALPALADDVASIADEVLTPASLPAAPASLDVAMEQRLLQAIAGHLGTTTVLSEEDFRRTGRERHPGLPVRVILDPLDGSARYAAGSDVYSVSLAVEVRGTLEAGLVYHPPSGVRYVALRGSGAWRDDTCLVTGDAGSRRVAVKSTLQHSGRVGSLCDRLTAAGYDVEPLGSTALKLCLLAEGRVAAVIKEVGVHHGQRTPWGIAAGAVVCAEAGQTVVDLDGRPWNARRTTLLAADRSVRQTLGWA